MSYEEYQETRIMTQLEQLKLLANGFVGLDLTVKENYSLVELEVYTLEYKGISYTGLYLEIRGFIWCLKTLSREHNINL